MVNYMKNEVDKIKIEDNVGQLIILCAIVAREYYNLNLYNCTK